MDISFTSTRQPVRGRHAGLAIAALAVAASAATAAPATAEAQVSARAAAARVSEGQVDVDVRTRGGNLLGVLHGHVRAAGNGLLTFRRHGTRAAVTEAVGVRATGLHGGRATLVARGADMHLTLRLDPDTGAVRGDGRLDRQAVRAAGVGAETLTDHREGKRLLVVGRPHGEGWAALRKHFSPVRFDARRHTRARLVDDREAFHSYAGIVFGQDVRPAQIRANGLLRAFYGAGKWVIAARATPRSAAAIGVVHPWGHRRVSSALAVRATGPEGDLQRVKPTVAFPDPPDGAARLSVVERRRAAAQRASWFRDHLRRYSAAHMASGRDSGRARAAQSSGSVQFNPGYGAMAIEIIHPWTEQVVLTGGGNRGYTRECGWNQTNWNAWCPDTSGWQQHAGTSDDYGDQAQAVCNWFLNNGYFMIDERAVKRVTNQKNSAGAYNIQWYRFDNAFIRRPGDACPRKVTQTALLQGEDFYWVLYDPNAGQHSVIALTDPTISLAQNGALAQGNKESGGGYDNGSGTIYHMIFTPTAGSLYQETRRTQWERAFFLVRYQQDLALNGANLSNTTFPYRGSLSIPQNQITQSESSTGVSESRGFSIGVFGTDGTINYSDTRTSSASVSIAVPNWQVNPLPGQRSISYGWQINTPLAFDTVVGGGGGTWDLNNLAVSDFNPASLTTWQGNATWGPLSVASTRRVRFADHYSTWDGNTDIADRFATNELVYDLSPDRDAPTPSSKAPAGVVGLDLCDANVRAPQFKDTCTTK